MFTTGVCVALACCDTDRYVEGGFISRCFAPRFIGSVGDTVTTMCLPTTRQLAQWAIIVAVQPERRSVQWGIGVVDDHHSLVRGLRAIIDEQPDMELVAAASTVPELLTTSTRIDLAVLDLRLEDGSSPRTNVELLREAEIPTLVYTSGDEPYLVQMAASAGVLGVLRKNVTDDEFVDAVRHAAAGVTVPTIDWAAALDSDPGFVDLSPQHRRGLELYAAGASTTAVAKSMSLSTETVKEYVDRIRTKYMVAGRPAPTKTDLYKRAIEDGWLPIPRRFRR